MAGNAFCFENHQVVDRLQIRVELEELALVDETPALLVYRQPVGVGLLQQRFVEVVAHLPLHHNLLGGRDALGGGVDVDPVALPLALAQPHFVARFRRQIGLRDVGLGVVGHRPRDFDDVLALVLDGLGQPQHVADFLHHAVYLAVEVVVVVDDAQMGVPRPCVDDFLVELSGQFQPLGALPVVGRGVVAFGPVGGRHQVEHGVVAAVAQPLRVGAHDPGDFLPHLRLHVGRDVHRAAVAHDDGGLLAGLRHAHELVFQGQLHFERGFLPFVEKGLVAGQIVHSRLRKHGGNFGDGEHLIAQTVEMFYHLDKGCGLAGTGAAGQYDSFDVVHSV